MVAPPSFTRITVADAVKAYLTNVHSAVLGGRLAESTEANYTRDLTEFVALCDDGAVLDDLTATDIDDVVLAYSAQPDHRYTKTTKSSAPGKKPVGRGPGAQTRFRASISRLFTYAARNAWVQQNPMPDTVVRPKTRDLRGAARTALPQATAAQLLDVPALTDLTSRQDQKLSARDTAILRILLEVGPRVSELAAFDRADLEDRDGDTWLRIRHGKGGKARDLPLSPQTAAHLKAYLALTRPTPVAKATATTADAAALTEDSERAMFTTFRGRRITPRDIQNLVNRAVSHLPADVRRRVTPHGLRHTAATLLLSSGAADVKTVQSLLGHASLATTGIYLDEVSHEMVRAVAAHPVTGR